MPISDPELPKITFPLTMIGAVLSVSPVQGSANLGAPHLLAGGGVHRDDITIEQRVTTSVGVGGAAVDDVAAVRPRAKPADSD